MKALPKIRYNAPFTITFAIVSLAVLFLGQVTGETATRMFFCVYRCSPKDPLAYLRLFGHVLGHTSFSHYSGNITLMLVLGPGLEEKYGSRNILMLTAATALISGLIHILLFDGVMLLGASGIVFMMILLSSMGNSENGTVPITLILVAILYIGGEIADGILYSDNISQLTHIIGGVCGAAFGLLTPKGRHSRKKKH